MPQRPFNLGTDPRGVFKGQGLEGPGGFADVLSNRAEEVEQRQGMGSIFEMSAEQSGKYGEPMMGMIGPLVMKVPIRSPLTGSYAFGEQVYTKVLKNPTKLQVQSFRENTAIKSVRAFKDPETGDIFIWDASEAIHADVITGLGKDYGELFRVIRKTGKDLNDFIPELETSVDVERFFRGKTPLTPKKGIKDFRKLLDKKDSPSKEIDQFSADINKITRRPINKPPNSIIVDQGLSYNDILRRGPAPDKEIVKRLKFNMKKIID